MPVYKSISGSCQICDGIINCKKLLVVSILRVPGCPDDSIGLSAVKQPGYFLVVFFLCHLFIQPCKDRSIFLFAVLHSVRHYIHLTG